ncbi:MAG: HAD hydrolase family protein [Myxococcota bacterium]
MSTPSLFIVATAPIESGPKRPVIVEAAVRAKAAGRLREVSVITEDPEVEKVADLAGAKVVPGKDTSSLPLGAFAIVVEAAVNDAPPPDLVQLLGVNAFAPLSSLAKLEWVAFDFDGVMTDDTVIVTEEGVESITANRGDGMGILRLKRAGVNVVVISKEINKVVAARCRKLDIPCHHGIDDKLTLFQDLARQKGVGPEQLAFVGNDVNDMECMEWASVGIAVANSRPEVLALADWVTQARGGHGAVREVCEAIIQAKS